MSTPLVKLVAIEVDNFKSFKGKRSIGIQGKTISIIGPNGTGKSNFMDAICFALGANTSALRVSKLEELIHGSDSDGQNSLEKCTSASLIFKTVESPFTPDQTFVPTSQALQSEPIVVESTPAPSRMDACTEHSFVASTPMPSSMGKMAKVPKTGTSIPLQTEGSVVTSTPLPSTHSSDFFVRRAEKEQSSLIPAVVQSKPVSDVETMHEKMLTGKSVVFTSTPSTHSSDFFVQHSQVDKPSQLPTVEQQRIVSSDEPSLIRETMPPISPMLIPPTVSQHHIHSQSETSSLSPLLTEEQMARLSKHIPPNLPLQLDTQSEPLFVQRVHPSPLLTVKQPRVVLSPIYESSTTPIPSLNEQNLIREAMKATCAPSNHENIWNFTRIICKNNNGTAVSQYKINGKNVNYSEYIRELQSLGISIRSNVFFIFQGKIEEIASKTPTELVKLFEQISGSINCKDEYDKYADKLNEIKSREVSDQLTLKGLKKKKQYFQLAAATSAQFDKMICEAKDAETLYFVFRLFSNERVFRVTTNQVDSYQTSINEKTCGLLDQEKNLKTMKKLKGEKEREVAVIDSIIDQLKKEVEEKSCILISSKEAMVQAKRKVDATEKTFRQSEMEKVNQMKSVEHLKKTRDDLTYIHGEKIKEFEAIDEKLSMNASKLATYHSLKAQLTSRAGNIIMHLESLQRDRSHQEEERSKFIDRENMRTEHKERIEANIAESCKRIANIQTNLRNGEQELVEKRETLVSLEHDMTHWKTDIAKLTDQLKEINAQIGDQNEAKLEHKKSDTRKCILLELQKEFGVNQVIGRVENLVRVSHEKYNIACARILEPHANKIVVNDDQTGVKCLRFLKEKQLGTATFLPLNLAKIRKPQHSLRYLALKYNKNIRMMIDVLLYESNIESAIVWITNNTLICETKEDASFVAYRTGEYKNAVSLDGTFYARSGLIHGGGVNHLARVYNSSRVEALESQRADIVERLIELSKKSSKSWKDVPFIAIEIQGLLKRNELCKRELALEQSKLEDFKNDLQKFTGSDLESKNQTQAIERAITSINKEIEAVKQEIGKVEKEIFAEFCASVGVDSIEIFEQMHFSQYLKRQDELQSIQNNIIKVEAELMYEISRDMQTKLLQRKKEFDETILALELKKEEFLSHEKDMASIEATLEAQVFARNEKETQLKIVEDDVKNAYSSLSKLEAELNKLIVVRGEHLVILQQVLTSRHQILQEAKNSGATLQFISGGWAQIDTASNLIQSPVDNDPDSLARINEEFLKIIVDYSLLRKREDLINLDLNDVKSTEENLKADFQLKETRKNEHRPTRGDEEEELRSLKLQIKTKERSIRNLYTQRKAVVIEFTRVRDLRIQKFNEMYLHVLSNIDTIYKDLTKSQGHIYFAVNDPLDPFASGISYSVTPEGRSYVDHKNLSGGERTMAALALIIAIWKFKPSPFILLDEMDAAMDNHNIEKAAQYFASVPNLMVITVTHKSQYYRQSDILFGITSQNLKKSNESLRSTLITWDNTMVRRISESRITPRQTLLPLISQIQRAHSQLTSVEH